jgi:hypothetical protein
MLAGIHERAGTSDAMVMLLMVGRSIHTRRDSRNDVCLCVRQIEIVDCIPSSFSFFPST